MITENPRFLRDKGSIDANNQLFPFITDKFAQIPHEWLDITLHEDEQARYRTIYLDPAFTINCEADYFGQPGVNHAMYNSSITLERYGFGRDVYERALAWAKEHVKNDDTPQYYEEFIRAYHNDPPLRLIHILVAKQFVSSQPFLLFGWISPNSPIYDLHAE
jgi:hypothetical protein